MSRRIRQDPDSRMRRRRECMEARREGMVGERLEREEKWGEAGWGGKAGG